MERGRIAVLSPHLDDAVLSCADVITPTTVVITVFAGVPGKENPVSAWDARCGADNAANLMLARRAEDVEAVSLLGGTVHHLDFLEHAYRQPDEPPPLPALRRAIAQVLADVDEVWAPAGVGGHPDHIVVRECALRLDGKPRALRLYADMPYSTRLLELSRARLAADAPSTAILEAWFRQVPGLLRRRPSARPETVLLSADRLAAKCAAISAYTSQRAALGQPVDPREEYAWRLR